MVKREQINLFFLYSYNGIVSILSEHDTLMLNDIRPILLLLDAEYEIRQSRERETQSTFRQRYTGHKQSMHKKYAYTRVKHSYNVVVGYDSVGYVFVLLQDPCFTRAGHESSLTRIVNGSNDTAGRGREVLVYGRINLLIPVSRIAAAAAADIARWRRIVIVEVSSSKPSSARRFSRIRF